MKLGFLYAGQGSQKIGMGQDFYLNYPSYQKFIDQISNSKLDIKEISFTDEKNLLNQTRYTQPCMTAFAVGVTDILRGLNILPGAALGLSLGEYGALYGAGVLDGEDVVDLVAFRGRAMEEAVAGLNSAMVAVLGLDREKLQQVCDQASELGVVEIANYNCPGQLVIGGEKIAVAKASELAREAGARRCLPLNVSGPFHTSLLAPAGDQLREKLSEMALNPPEIPVLFNCLGGENRENIPIATLLERQVQSSVYLEECIRSMAALGVDAMIEIGPGRVLSGFVRKILPQMPVYPLENCQDLDNLLLKLAQED